MKPQNVFIFFILVVAACFSCEQKTTKKQEPLKKININYVEKKLDTGWVYQVLVPENYQIKKSGAIDFFTYSLTASDSATNNFGEAEIFFAYSLGGPVYPKYNLKVIKDSTVIGKILNTPVEWRIFQYENLITAETTLQSEKIHNVGAKVSATSYSNLDSLIKIVSSLSRTD